MVREVVLGWLVKDRAWEQHFHIQAAFCQFCPGINEGDPLAGSLPVGRGTAAFLVAALPNSPVQLFQNHLQPGKWGSRRDTPNQAEKSGLVKLVPVCWVSHILPDPNVSWQTFPQTCLLWWHRTAATIKDLESIQKVVAGPTQGGWASSILGELIMGLTNTGTSRHVVCTPKEFGRLEGVCSAATVLRRWVLP